MTGVMERQRQGTGSTRQARSRPDSFDQTCPNAPAAPSSDPDTLPVEPAVAPLVFELRRLGSFRPCWSCEGHAGHDGRPCKLPQVWFWCESMPQVRALSDAMKALERGGVLNARWDVGVTPSGDASPETTFAVRPEAGGASCGLKALHADLRRLAVELPGAFRHAARKLGPVPSDQVAR